MRIVVIGAGSIGSRHIRNLIALGVDPREIEAIDQRDEALSGLPWGVRRHKPGDAYTLGLSQAQAALICVPAGQHARYARQAIEARLPFFLEKPAVLSVCDLSPEDWQPDVPHLVACNMRFRPELVALRAQFYGRPHVLVRMLSAADMRQWSGSAYGPVVAEMSHEIDLALWLVGGGQASVTSAHVSGSVASIWFDHDSRGRSHVLLDGQAPMSRRWRVDAGREWAEYLWPSVPTDVNQMYLDEMAHFLRVVRGEDVSCNTLADARRVVEICEQVKS